VAKSGSMEEMTMNMQSPYNDSIQTIDAVLRQIELKPKSRNFIFQSFDDLPILKRGPKELSVFLENLKTRGVIESYSIGPGLIFYITGPNKQRLIEERKRLVNFDQPQATKRSAARSTENKGPIKKLELVRPRSGNKFKVVINEDYLSPVQADKAISSWDLLFRIAEGEDIIDADHHKNAIDYFNFNKKCRLYIKTGHSITKILKVEGGYISPAIEIKMITEKAFQQRANKS